MEPTRFTRLEVDALATAVLIERASLSIQYEVERGVIRSHEAALTAWREGRLPTAAPPASPLMTVTTGA